MKNLTCSFVVMLIVLSSGIFAQNPLITDQFTADPTARLFEGKIYVYPSHDVNCGTDWFCMKDYHVFSSEDLVNWTDHGKILDQEDVAWVNASSNAMWAPDAYEKDGTYYFYFPAIADTNSGFRGRLIGVATSDTPYGPFTPEEAPIEGVFGIDPNVFIDHDGEEYLYWSGRGISGAKLSSNMMEIESEPVRLDAEHPQSGLREGPFVFERNGIYYLTYPRVIENTEALVYATGDNPLGPFEYKGIFMDEHPSGCWTNHHSIVNYKGQWYLFYHHNDLSPDFDKNRSIMADELFFNEDGSIQKVISTHRGVGISKATDKIQIDRYSEISESGAVIAFNDTSNTFAGWKTQFSENNAWVSYNDVQFDSAPQSISLKVLSKSGATLKIETMDGESSEIKIPSAADWKEVSVPVSGLSTGLKDLKLSIISGNNIEIDWVQFK